MWTQCLLFDDNSFNTHLFEHINGTNSFFNFKTVNQFFSNIFIGDPQACIRDLQIFIRDPGFLFETLKLSLETTVFRWRPPDFRWIPPDFSADPNIFIRDP